MTWTRYWPGSGASELREGPGGEDAVERLGSSVWLVVGLVLPMVYGVWLVTALVVDATRA